MKLCPTIISTCLCLVAMAQGEEASRRRNFNTENDVAMREFDPVTYFSNKPTKGNPKIYERYKGITYCFSNEANKEEFKKNPAKYEPAYGGWDAYSMAVNGERIKVLPTVYKIIDGKIYLFYNFKNSNNLLKWNKEEKKLKKSADHNWIAKMH